MTRSVDMHNHMVAADVVAFLEKEGDKYATRIIERDGNRQFLIQETATRPLNDKIATPEARLVDMDADGVDIQAVSCVPFVMYPEVSPELGLAISQVNNEALLRIGQKYPDRFVPLASVPLQDPDLAAKEAERVAKLGFRGLEIPSKLGSFGYDEPQYEAFWAACEANKLVVCLHPFEAAPAGPLARYNLGNFVGNMYDTGLAAALLICGGVLERHPDLRVLLFHGGGALPSIIGRIDNGYKMAASRMPIPRPPSTYLNQLAFDTITHNHNMLRYLAATYGSDHIVVGSDYPLGGGGIPKPITDLKSVGFNAEDYDQIAGGAAHRLLRLA